MAAIIVLAFLAFVLAFSCIKIVRPYQRGVVERLGRYKGTVDPGLRIIVPFVDRVHMVDMREQVVEVPPQEVITSDNVVVAVYAVVYHEATDAKRLMYNVSNFELAVTKLAQTNLRNLIGDLDLDDALTSSAKINTHLRDILDDSTDKWGVRVVRVRSSASTRRPTSCSPCTTRCRPSGRAAPSSRRRSVSARPPSPERKVTSRPPSSRRRGSPRRSSGWPTPRSIARPLWPKARLRRPGPCSRPCTTATRHPTS